MAAPIAATLILRTKQFSKGISTAAKGVGVLGGALGKLGGLIGKITLAFTAFAGVIAALILRQTALIDRIGKVSKVTGVASDTLQKFSFAAELAGVSTDQAEVALRRFSRRLGEAQKGTGELAPELKRLGIELRDSNGEFKSAEDVLFELADAIKNTEGASARLSIAFKAFDSEGAELVNVLNQGGDAMRRVFERASELGAVLSASAIAGVERFNDAMTELRKLANGIANVFVAALAPALTKVTLDFTNFLVKIGKEKGEMEDFGNFLKNEFLDILANVVVVFGKMANMLIAVTNSIVRLARKLDIVGLPELTGDAKEAQEELEALNEAIETPLGFVTPDTKKLLDALEAAGHDVEEFQKRFDDLGFFRKFMRNDELQVLKDDIQVFLDGIIADLEERAGTTFSFFDVEGLKEYILSLKDVKSEADKTNEPVEEQLTLFQRIIAQLQKAPDLLDAFQKKVFDIDKVLKDVATRLGTPMERLQKTIEDGLVKGVEIFEDTLTDAILKGKADFTALGDHIKKVLAKALVQRFITGPILSIFGLADGGPAKAGQPYVVGEEGPELFVPKQSGTVIPNDEMATGGSGMFGSTTVNYNINAIDSRSFEARLAENPEFLFNVTRVGSRRQPA